MQVRLSLSFRWWNNIASYLPTPQPTSAALIFLRFCSFFLIKTIGSKSVVLKSSYLWAIFEKWWWILFIMRKYLEYAKLIRIRCWEELRFYYPIRYGLRVKAKLQSCWSIHSLEILTSDSNYGTVARDSWSLSLGYPSFLEEIEKAGDDTPESLIPTYISPPGK